MTVLQELAALYERRAEEAHWPRQGFSSVGIGAEVVLGVRGRLLAIRSLMAPDSRGKMQPKAMPVPSVSRTSGIRPAFLWDKTAYALGITLTETGPGQRRRTAEEHAAFRALHLDRLEKATDPALLALRTFCETWDPEQFADFPDAAVLVDQNVVFRLDEGPHIHTLPEARALVATGGGGTVAMCLLSGTEGPVARLHPTIKGVAGAQSSGAALVSFNEDAYTSHGKEQGDNAPVSEAAAFAYGTALNALLAKGSRNTVRIGDATVVFWAAGDISGAEAETEDALAAAFAEDASGRTDADEEPKLRRKLEAVARGQVPEGSRLDPRTRVFVLGLAPNAARLSVRFWHPGTLGDLALHVTRFWSECSITPSPFARGRTERLPKPWSLLFDLGAQRDAKNISPTLGGELMRAILSGTAYPATLLTAVIGRLRVEGEPDRVRHGNVDGRRAAMIRAALIRNYEREVPMALDEDSADVAYLLGRLFGVYAYAERSYQERGAGLRQKFLGAASATPARIFPVLMRGYEHNLAALRKAGGHKAAAGVKADRAVAAILSRLPGGGELPAALPLEEQGRFFIGFYHQTSSFYAKAEDAAEPLLETPQEVTE